MQEIIILLLLGSAGAVSGIPQALYSKYKDSLGNIGYSLSKKWLHLKKGAGFFDAKKQIYFEKSKTERAIKNLIEVISGYEAVIEEYSYEIRKLSLYENTDNNIKELTESIDKIKNKSNEARVILSEQRKNLLDINNFIIEVESDKIFYTLDKSEDTENEFLKHKANIENIRGKKNV